MSEKRVKVFVAGHCEPCQEVKELLKEGAFVVDGEEGASVELIDIETDEGYTEMLAHEVPAVPTAFAGGKQCKIGIDREEGVVVLECPNE